MERDVQMGSLSGCHKGSGLTSLHKSSLAVEMRAAGVEVRHYNPPGWFNLHRMNHRTHRKILVVDGRVGFTGGVGLADAWSGNAQDADHWRDTYYVARGPVVAQLQGAFTDNWLEATGGVLHGPHYFPSLHENGRLRAHVFTSAPGGGSETMQLMYLLSVTAATRTIDIAASHFLPDDIAIQAIVTAAWRGVRVRILLSGTEMDRAVVRHASSAHWGDLLKADVDIYENRPTMFHCKLLVVDGRWVSVGATNFDDRSLSVNDKANMNVYDVDFAQRQTEIFEAYLLRFERITLTGWRDRTWPQKVLDTLASGLRSQL